MGLWRWFALPLSYVYQLVIDIYLNKQYNISMDFKSIKLINPVDASVLAYAVDNITGKIEPDVSDQTVLIFQDGSVHATEPATPEGFRGDKIFRQLRHLPPVKGYTGRMVVNRQGGVPRSISFE